MSKPVASFTRRRTSSRFVTFLSEAVANGKTSQPGSSSTASRNLPMTSTSRSMPSSESAPSLPIYAARPAVYLLFKMAVIPSESTR